MTMNDKGMFIKQCSEKGYVQYVHNYFICIIYSCVQLTHTH